MALPEYKNLTDSELVWADHYAETGNNAGLREMRRVSREREEQKPVVKDRNGGSNE